MALLYVQATLRVIERMEILILLEGRERGATLTAREVWSAASWEQDFKKAS